MTKKKNYKYLTSIIILTVLIILISLRAKHPMGYEKYFNESAVMTVNIIMDDKAWNDMIANALKEKYARCDVVINGERINDVGIRPKGNASLQQVSMLGSQRYSFKLEFDHYIKNQTFHGLDKLVLNNSLSDASFMKEFMSFEIYKEVGVAVPLHSYAQIQRNGANCGLYLALEAVEDAYSTRVFGKNYGKLYKPESNKPNGIWDTQKPVMQSAITDNLMNNHDANKADISAIIGAGLGVDKGIGSGSVGLVYQGDDIQDYSAVYDNAVFDTTEKDFERVIEAIKNINNGTDLEKYIDIDATLRFFAAQAFILNFDSYFGGLGHNYYLYEEKGQLTMLPWDLNLSFAGYYSGDTNSAINYPIDTPLNGVTAELRPMLTKLLEVTEYREKYHKYLKQIVENYILNGKFTNKVKKTNQLIQPYVEHDLTSLYTLKQYEAAVPVLDEFAILRAESIKGQLNGTIPSTKDGQADNISSSIKAGNLDISVFNPLINNAD